MDDYRFMTASRAFRTLGIDSGASEAEIRAAYRREALFNHPDKNPHDVHAGERFLLVAEAFRSLVGTESDEEIDEV